MKNVTKKISGCVVALAIVFVMASQLVAGQVISKTADGSIAYRVKNGYTGTCTIVVNGAGTNYVVTADGLVTTLTPGTMTNMTEIAAKLIAITNRAGTAGLTVNSEPSLTNDTVLAKILSGTYTILAGKWGDILWDTDAHLSYSLYFPSRTYFTGVAPYILGSVHGVPTGTGNVTASIYKAGVLVAQKIITSPVYVNPATWMIPYAAGTTDVSSVYTNSFTADSNVTLEWNLNMPFSGEDAVIVRVTRATTATTGNIGAIIPNE